MGARNISNAEWFAKHMKELHAELERDKRIRARQRKEHRLAWRRAYWARKKEEAGLAPSNYDHLAALREDKDEQKRAGKIKWKVGDAVKTLREWSAEICAAGVQTTPVDLEDILVNAHRAFLTVDALVAYVCKPKTS